MLPQLGKLDRESFNRIIFPYLGKEDSRVIVGPKHGVDAAVIALDDGPVGRRRVMAVAEDPTFGMPVLMPYFGWGIVHICASDVAVLGIRPQFMTICLLLPPGIEEEVLAATWKQVHEECLKLGIAVVGGHTGIYGGMPYPLNGGCTVWGFGNEEEITPASAARPGDLVLMTKGPAIEATGILAIQAEAELNKAIGAEMTRAGKELFLEMTVVKDALALFGCARAMHDATEGGLLNGVYEMAEASGIGVRLQEKDIFTPEAVTRVCDYFEIDPLISISEGTLVAAVPPARREEALARLRSAGVPAWFIGEFTESGRTFERKDGSVQELEPVKVDPFWAAYFKALS